jgi:hypothetical protein
MRTVKSLFLAALSLISGPAAAADADHPAVVELFQSQGCSSCPPANDVLNALADRPDVIALSFAVTYWDQLGWKDSFAHPAFTARQWEYAKARGAGNVFTPQMVVNGRGVLVGSRRAEAEAAIRRYERVAPGPAIDLVAGRIGIGAGQHGRPANVWLIRYDPRLHRVAVRAGENGGRTLPHRNIVREVHLLGKWRGGPVSFAMPAARDGALRSVVLVQDGPGGAILSASRI